MGYTATAHWLLSMHCRALMSESTGSPKAPSPMQLWEGPGHGAPTAVRKKSKTMRGRALSRNDFAYPAMTTPAWECTSQSTASGMCSSSLTAPLRLCIRKRDAVYAAVGTTGRQSTWLFPTSHRDFLLHTPHSRYLGTVSMSKILDSWKAPTSVWTVILALSSRRSPNTCTQVTGMLGRW
jgi:hypothetical protein